MAEDVCSTNILYVWVRCRVTASTVYALRCLSVSSTRAKPACNPASPSCNFWLRFSSATWHVSILRVSICARRCSTCTCTRKWVWMTPCPTSCTGAHIGHMYVWMGHIGFLARHILWVHVHILVHILTCADTGAFPYHIIRQCSWISVMHGF